MIFTIGTGGLVLIFVLLILGYILGFAAGNAYVLRKIKELCSYEDYRNILSTLHADANKKED